MDGHVAELILDAMTFFMWAHWASDNGKRWYDGFVVCQIVQAELDFPELCFLCISG